MRTRDCWRLAVWVGLYALVARPVAAQTPTPMADWQHSPGVALVPYFVDSVPRWQWVVAAGTVGLPSYEGAQQLRLTPVAAAELRYRNIAYFSTSEGIGYNLFKSKSYRIGSSLGYDLGRAQRRAPRLTGLGDIEGGPELRFYAEKVWFPLVLRASARHTLDGRTGWSADFSAYLPVAGGQTYFVLAGPAVAIADGAANQRRFGVSAAQAQQSGLPQYSASGGLRNASLGFSATYFLDRFWFCNATGSVQRLLGAAADSPVVEDKLQTALLLVAGYRW